MVRKYRAELLGIIAAIMALVFIVKQIVHVREGRLEANEKFCAQHEMDPVYDFYGDSGKPRVKMCIPPGSGIVLREDER